MRTLPARRVGLGANSVFGIAPQPDPAGSASYYADAKAQIANVISFASSYAPGSPSDIARIASAVNALATDVNNFNAADKSAVTSSILWAQILADAPTPHQVVLGVYPTGAAQSLALDATTIQSMISLMPSVGSSATAAADVAATAEQNARILTARRGNVSAISPGATAPASPVTVIAQQPAAPSALSQLPWNFIIGGALVVGAVLLVTEKKR